MRAGLAPLKDKKQLKSIPLVYMLVATSMLVVFPLSVPKASAQVIHLASASLEDAAGLPYDIGPVGDGVVLWDHTQDHWISGDYTVEIGFTLNIPALDFMGNPASSNEIIFKNENVKIDVWGTLITNSDDDQLTSTLFWGENLVNWSGIIFHDESAGVINDCIFMDAKTSLFFSGGAMGSGPSRLLYPGINMSTFMNMRDYGITSLGPSGYTNIQGCTFIDSYNSAIAVDMGYSNFNMKDCLFISHGNNKPSLRLSHSDVNIERCNFLGNNQPGKEVYIRESSGTVLEGTTFEGGASDDYYVHVAGAAPLISNCTFDTSGGSLSVLAAETSTGIPAHPIVRQPSGSGSPGMWDDSFDNSTLNATETSSITLQWYMNVNVVDPDGNLIDNAPVWVKDRLGNPAEPPFKATDASGWAREIIVTELIQYNNSATNFNPFNVSALNNSMMGYADPEPMMNMSKEVTVIVPFNPVSNTPPIVSQIDTPLGVQSGLVSIPFRLSDPDVGDDGNLSVLVEWLDPTGGMGWISAFMDPSSDPTTNLNNNTLYTFVWDSEGDFPDGYSTVIKIRITPSDRAGLGTSNETLTFTLDNKAPDFLSGPVVTPTNTTALIEWTVDEPANASVRYGLNPTLTSQKSGTTGTTLQSVTLTGLQPGRNYTYVIESTDSVGNNFSSTILTFETEIHIKLYEGWNMISIPPILEDFSLGNALGSIAGEYDAVQAYDVFDPFDLWKHNRPGKPYGNDLTMVNEIMGLWIHMKKDAILIPGHTDPTPFPGFPGFTTMPLEAGWNFVGYPSVTTRLIDDALKDEFGNPITYDMVQTYDAVTGQWLNYDGSSGSLTQMEMGRGYWIHCTASCIWQVDYV